MVPAKTVSGSWLLVLSVGAIIISIAFIGVAYVALSPKQGGTMFGTLFVNEGGYSNSTASATASYNATLTANSGNGSDPVHVPFGDRPRPEPPAGHEQLHDQSVNQISMTIGGHTVLLPWEDNDTVWAGAYDNNYIASWGPTAPGYELRGQVNPSLFGLPSNAYVEFRFEAEGGEASPAMLLASFRENHSSSSNLKLFWNSTSWMRLIISRRRDTSPKQHASEHRQTPNSDRRRDARPDLGRNRRVRASPVRSIDQYAGRRRADRIGGRRRRTPRLPRPRTPRLPRPRTPRRPPPSHPRHRRPPRTILSASRRHQSRSVG